MDRGDLIMIGLALTGLVAATLAPMLVFSNPEHLYRLAAGVSLLLDGLR